MGKVACGTTGGRVSQVAAGVRRLILPSINQGGASRRRLQAGDGGLGGDEIGLGAMRSSLRVLVPRILLLAEEEAGVGEVAIRREVSAGAKRLGVRWLAGNGADTAFACQPAHATKN